MIANYVPLIYQQIYTLKLQLYTTLLDNLSLSEEHPAKMETVKRELPNLSSGICLILISTHHYSR